jgi:hypothetical protein
MSGPKTLRKQGLILMNSIIAEEAKELAGSYEPAEVLSIYAALQQLPDTRRKQGRRYPLVLILTYVLLAKAAGETTPLAKSRVDSLAGCLAATGAAGGWAELSVCSHL